MKKEIADIWVKALRSGNYKQTEGHLKAGDGYCCLGVLCEVLGAKFVPNPEYYKGDEDRSGKPIRSRAPYVVEFQGKTLAPTDVLPEEIASVAGINTNGGRFNFDNEAVDGDTKFPYTHDELTELNDFGIGFGKIADVIERFYENL